MSRRSAFAGGEGWPMVNKKSAAPGWFDLAPVGWVAEASERGT